MYESCNCAQVIVRYQEIPEDGVRCSVAEVRGSCELSFAWLPLKLGLCSTVRNLENSYVISSDWHRILVVLPATKIEFILSADLQPQSKVKLVHIPLQMDCKVSFLRKWCPDLQGQIASCSPVSQNWSCQMSVLLNQGYSHKATLLQASLLLMSCW